MKILYIDIDSLRPDHLGCYGYKPPTTPNIDTFSEDAVQFDRAYTANSPCMPSRAAFLTGRYGINNGVTTHGPEGESLYNVDKWAPTLSELFFKNQTPTAAVTSFPRHPAKWFYHLWHKFRHPQELPEEGFQSPRGEDITQLATDLFTSHSDENFFQYVQYWDPHSPYRRSEQEVEQFRSYPLPSYPTTQQITDHQSWDTWRSAKAPGCAEEALQYIDVDSITNKEVLNELISHYDAEIRYVDKWIGKLLNVLREQQIYDETLIIITSDHGEEFGEHGVYREHWSTHEGTQRVPLLVKPPAEVKYTPGSRDQLVTNVDLAPTITNLAGIQTPASWQGQSLRSILEDKSISWRDRIVVDHGLYTAQRAVIADRWKFIRTYNAGMWEETVANRQLFDLKEDPWEQENVIESDPKIAEGLEVKMLEWAEIHRSTHEDSLLRTARIGPIGSDRHST